MEVEFMIRLDKFLSEMGVGTRQEVKQYIRKGKVEVDARLQSARNLKWTRQKQMLHWTVNESDMPLMYTIC